MAAEATGHYADSKKIGPDELISQIQQSRESFKAGNFDLHRFAHTYRGSHPMHELMNAIRTLAIMAIGFAVMLHLITPGQAFKKIARMIITPFIVLFAWTFVVQIWAVLSPVARVVVIGIGVPLSGVFLFFGTRFGREVSASVVGNWVYDGLRNGCGCAGRLLAFLLILALILVLFFE